MHLPRPPSSLGGAHRHLWAVSPLSPSIIRYHHKRPAEPPNRSLFDYRLLLFPVGHSSDYLGGLVDDIKEKLVISSDDRTASDNENVIKLRPQGDHFGTRGLVYYLGSNGVTTPWANPGRNPEVLP